jgi:hypothetical protein
MDPGSPMESVIVVGPVNPVKPKLPCLVDGNKITKFYPAFTCHPMMFINPELPKIVMLLRPNTALQPASLSRV